MDKTGVDVVAVVAVVLGAVVCVVVVVWLAVGHVVVFGGLIKKMLGRGDVDREP